jgi:hypothetical protein
VRVRVDAVLKPLCSPGETGVTEEEVALGEGVGDVSDVGRDGEKEEVELLAKLLPDGEARTDQRALV